MTSSSLRADLVVSPRETEGGPCYVVKDPRSGRLYRFSEPEFLILSRLDADRPLDLIRREVERRFDVELSPQTLTRFVDTVHRQGLLNTSPDETAVSTHGRVRGSALYLRWKAWDPDRFLVAFLPWVRIFYTRAFVAFSLVVVAAAVMTTVGHASELSRGIGTLFTMPGLALAWVTVLLVTVAHELAHGFTCRHFGGQVREMGVMLIYFHPALYCNVSDAWLFPEKWKRLLVTFAGVHLDFVTWGLATLIWRITPTDTVLNRAALLLVAACGVRMFFNLNPLIKLDGYYLLSDVLEIPNLRQRAAVYLRARVWNRWGRHLDVASPSPKERRVYLVYGVLSSVYSVVLLGTIGYAITHFLIARLQAVGALLSIAFVTMFVRSLSGRTRPPSAGGRPGFPRSGMRRLRRLAIVGAFTGATAAVLWFGHWDLTVAGPFEVMPARNADVRAEIDGIIETVFVDEGDRVEAGDPIARLGARDYRSQLLQIEAEIAARLAERGMLEAGPRSQEIALAEAAVETARSRLSYATRAQVRARSLREQGLMSVQEAEDADESVAVSERELDEADRALQVLLAGSRPEEVKAVTSEISRLEAQRAQVQEQLELLTITTPHAGLVTTPKLHEKVGEHVGAGDLVAEVYELSTVKVEIAVPEREIADIRKDQLVEIRATAYPTRSFTGRVVSIATMAVQDDLSRTRSILVTTEIENQEGLLKPQMTGYAKIGAGRLRLLDLVRRRLVRLVRVEVWTWW